MRAFDELITEAAAMDMAGWDFGWLRGRATEQRPPWGYQRMMRARLARASVALDLQTGGGEVLAGAGRLPPTMIATESWLPNLLSATRRLRPLGVMVVAAANEPPLPFAGETFELITSRHPVNICWSEIGRVLRPGGSYLAQHVGPESMIELREFFLGSWDRGRDPRDPDAETAAACAVGLDVVSVRSVRLHVEFFDVGAVVYFLRKVIWTVPGFTVDRHLGRLRDLDQQIRRDGPFLAYATRTLIEVRRPAAGED